MEDTDKSFKTVDKWKTTEYQHHKYIDLTLEKDKSKYYTTFYSKDLSECDECGGSIVKFDFGEVTCVNCGLVHVSSDKFHITSTSYKTGGTPRTELSDTKDVGSYSEVSYNNRLKNHLKNGIITQTEFDLYKFKTPKVPFEKIKDRHKKAKQMLLEYRNWLLDQHVTDWEKEIALGYFYQLQKYGYGFRGGPSWTKEDIYMHILSKAKDPDFESTRRLKKYFKMCCIVHIPLVTPLKSSKAYFDNDKLTREARMQTYDQKVDEMEHSKAWAKALKITY